MKKNSFKRFLAVTLAAATALTFAPVSTLGLTGVVQAEAADITLTNGFSDTQSAITAGGTIYIAKGETKDGITLTGASATLTAVAYDKNDTSIATASAGTTGNTIKLTGNKVGKIDITVSATDFGTGGSGKITVVVYDLSSIVAATDDTVELPVSGSKKLVNSLTFADDTKAKYSATTEADGTKFIESTGTLYAGDTVEASSNEVVTVKAGTTTIGTLTWGVTTVASGAKVTFGSATDDVAGKSITYTWDAASDAWTPDPTQVAGELTVTAEGGSTGLDVDTDNHDVATANISSGTVTITPAISGKVAKTKLYIYPSSAAKTADDKKTGKGTLTSVEVHFDVIQKNTIKAKTVTNDGTKYKFAFELTNKNLMSSGEVKYLDASGNDASLYFIDDSSTAFTAQTGDLTVSTSTAPKGSYTVELLTSAGKLIAKDNFTVAEASNGGTVNTNTNPAKSDIFGGVTTNIVVTDDTDYSLVNADSTFALDGKTYTASQLKWYLTSDPTITPQNIKLSNSVAILTNSGENTVGKLDLHVANADDFKANANNQYIEGVYCDGANNTIVYSTQINVYATKGKTIKYSASTSKDKAGAEALKASDLFDGIELIGVNNKKLKGDDSVLTGDPQTTAVGTDRNFTAAFNDPNSKDDNGLKTSTFAANSGFTAQDGVYVEKYYVPYRDTNAASGFGYFVAEITVTVSVNAGPSIEVKEGNFSYSDPTVPADDRVIVLDLSKNKTFDIKGHTVSNMDNTTYEYSVDTLNVTVDKDGVATAAKVGTAVVTVTPKNSSGVKGTPVTLYFRVNQYANDDITVTGKDGDKATVLTTRQYNGNSNKLTSEAALAAAQVGYVQIEVTGKEAADVKEDLTVKGTGKRTFALADKAKNNESVDAKTGQIRISHAYLNSDDFVPYTFAVKVTSSETSTSALTTGYFYVVVDYADAQLTGLEKSYSIGTSQFNPTYYESWLDLTAGKDSKVKTNGIASVNYLTKYDDLDDANLYTDDDAAAFVGTDIIYRATTAGKTAHLLFATGNPSRKIGMKYQVVELKSVPGKSNYVTKVVNTATGKTIYEADGVTSGAAITIDKTTVLKVSVAYTPDASLNPREDPAFTIAGAGDDFNYNTTNLFVAATEDPKTYEVTLIPSQEGTQLITILPTSGRLTTSDYSLVDETDLNIAVKYDSSAATTKPAKVTGLKLSQKKGAKVSVKFNKVTTNATMRYYVQKKVSGKTSGKSIGSTKTTLSVAKGKTVKVRVKAYYYDENGTKHVGAYSAWKTLKTDKK